VDEKSNCSNSGSSSAARRGEQGEGDCGHESKIDDEARNVTRRCQEETEMEMKMAVHRLEELAR
jgi:hypothetical protein